MAEKNGYEERTQAGNNFNPGHPVELQFLLAQDAVLITYGNNNKHQRKYQERLCDPRVTVEQGDKW